MSVEVERIDDPDDPRLDDFRTLTDPELRKRYETQRGVFIVESPLAVDALAGSPHAPATRSLLVGEARRDRMAAAIETLGRAGATIFTAPAEVLRATAGFELHRGVVAAVDRPVPVDPTDLLARARTVLAIEAVNDHENLGALFRNAAAFGVDAVVLDPRCADPFYRRCVRVSMGHVLRVPHARDGRWPALVSGLADDGWSVLALTPRADQKLHALDVPATGSRLAVVVGAEGTGLDAATLASRGIRPVRIAMAEGVDSLNVAAAAAIALAHLRAPHLT